MFETGLAGAAVAMLLALGVQERANASLAQRHFDEAVKSFKDGRRTEAFTRFTALANHGDVDAARIALFLLNYGAVLYGTNWEARLEDVEYWNMLVRNSSPASARAEPAFVPLAVAPQKTRLKQVPTGKAWQLAAEN